MAQKGYAKGSPERTEISEALKTLRASLPAKIPLVAGGVEVSDHSVQECQLQSCPCGWPCHPMRLPLYTDQPSRSTQSSPNLKKILPSTERSWPNMPLLLLQMSTNVSMRL